MNWGAKDRVDPQGVRGSGWDHTKPRSPRGLPRERGTGAETWRTSKNSLRRPEIFRPERQGRYGASKGRAPAAPIPSSLHSCLDWAGLTHLPLQYPSGAAQLWLPPRPGRIDSLWMLSIFSKNHQRYGIGEP